ncbi:MULTISPECIES: AAA family ATPase [Actinomyces]|uniref:ATP-binding protein n=1 Tax=Actinomyces respiraculi TaxID=2744574 RepID=A0A7T0LL82_9ACTO|nr:MULTISPECIES: AAA family ATPase [Actinomyces]QPL05667.1 ATP-binding protein [Actinomyces respiraculi]
MRTPLDSPFSPGSDAVPQIWAGRSAQLSDWRDVLRPRRLAGLPERGRTILGEAGTGKSALVRRIAAHAAASGDWVTDQLRMPLGADPLKRLASALLALAASAGLSTAADARVGALLARVEAVAVSGVSLSLRQAPGAEPYTDLTSLLLEIGRAALRRGVVVLIHLDEVQNITRPEVLSHTLIALGDALSHEEEITLPGGVVASRALPVVVYLTGLPEFADMAGARSGATFARRFRTTILDSIGDDDLGAALQPLVTEGWPILSADGDARRVHMSAEARDLIVERACGEPFLFQLAGERAWYAGTSDLITADDVVRGWSDVAPEAEAHVQRLLERLPERERHFLDAMAGLEAQERTLTAITQAMGLSKATEAGTTARRLDLNRRIVQRGKPYSFRHRAIGAYLTSDWPAPS